jgi:hypothetical protein
VEPDRYLYLALPETAWIELFETRPIGQLLLEEYNQGIRLIVFDLTAEEILRWIP